MNQLHGSEDKYACEVGPEFPLEVLVVQKHLGSQLVQKCAADRHGDTDQTDKQVELSRAEPVERPIYVGLSIVAEAPRFKKDYRHSEHSQDA